MWLWMDTAYTFFRSYCRVMDSTFFFDSSNFLKLFIYLSVYLSILS